MKRKIQKSLVIGSIFILLSIVFLPVNGIESQENKEINNNPLQSTQGNTLYVGGSGPNNYTSIQNAVNDAVDGDTVFVYDDSSPYNEHVLVNKSIILIGEDKNTTLIEGNEGILKLRADNITISGFTIKRESHGGIGIDIGGVGHIVIIQNIITNYDSIYGNSAHDISITENIFNADYARTGIWLDNCNSVIVSNNFINSYHIVGLNLECCKDIQIFNNEIRSNWCGIYEDGTSHDTQIFNNYLANNNYGINIYISNLKLYNNTIEKNNYGLVCGGWESLIYSNELKDNGLDIIRGNNKVYQNNFINDTLKFEYQCNFILKFLLSNFPRLRNIILTIWFKYHTIPIEVDRNYWENHPSNLPKRINGDIIWYTGFPGHEEKYLVSWYIYDLHPAPEPYDI